MTKKETDRIKKKVQKLEKTIFDFNERINKELQDVINLLDTDSTSNGGAKVAKRRTPRGKGGSDELLLDDKESS